MPLSSSRLLVSLIALAGLTTASTAEAADRKVVAERAGCSVSVGDRDAGGNDLMVADCVWPVPIAKAVAAVKAADKHDDYLSSVEESTTLPDGRVLQIHFASGISNRQVTLAFTNQDLPGGGVKVSWTRAAIQEPMRDGLVDVPLSDGSWEVTPDPSGGVKVVYSLRYDAGGSIPTWIVRNFQKGGIADIVEQMREAIEKQ